MDSRIDFALVSSWKTGGLNTYVMHVKASTMVYAHMCIYQASYRLQMVRRKY